METQYDGHPIYLIPIIMGDGTLVIITKGVSEEYLLYLIARHQNPIPSDYYS